eukprot:2121888-Rhodomonas_salina.1
MEPQVKSDPRLCMCQAMPGTDMRMTPQLSRFEIWPRATSPCVSRSRLRLLLLISDCPHVPVPHLLYELQHILTRERS